jgi:TatA/E family protein of Tat protein translocase
MPFNIGPFELLLVLILALLILGPGKLPEVGRALGRTIGEFRHASTNLEEAMSVDATPARPAAPPVATAASASTVAQSAPDVREDRAAT